MKKVSSNKNKTKNLVKQSNSEYVICNFHTFFSESFELRILLTTKTNFNFILSETHFNFMFLLFALMLFGNSPLQLK